MFNYTHMMKAEQTEIAAVNNCRCFLGFVSRSSSINSPPHLPLQRKQPNMIPTSGIRKALTTDREERIVRGRFSAMAWKEQRNDHMKTAICHYIDYGENGHKLSPRWFQESFEWKSVSYDWSPCFWKRLTCYWPIITKVRTPKQSQKWL